MKIIDFHTHAFPERLAKGAISSLEHTSGSKAALNGTIESLLSSMKRCGVSESVLMPIAVKKGNSHTINTCAIENDKIPSLHSFGSVHPHDDNIQEELERIKKAGLKGIKLHPDFQGVFIDDPKTVAVMQLCTQLGLIVMIHCGMDPSFPDVHRSTPKRLHKVLPELHGGKIICAHSGGYRYNDEVLEYLVGHEEVYIDTSFSLGQPGMDTEKIREIYLQFDPTHILFGTDSPWEDQALSAQKLLSLKLPERLYERVFSENAEALLK